MSFSNTPVVSTYSSHKVPMANAINLRPGSNIADPFLTDLGQDAGMINAVCTKVRGSEDVFEAVTRPVISGHQITLAGETGTLRGMYVWEKTAGTVYYFAVIGTKVYTATSLTSAGWTNVTTLSTNVKTPVRFTEFITSTNNKKLVLVDGVQGYVFTDNTAGLQIVDADFPNPHVPFPVFVDGYLFLAKSGTGDIYNCDLDDPFTWTAGSFISSELYPDDIQALIKMNNYILAVGKEGSEYFYDAANATASPLARYEGSSLPFGTQFPNSIAFSKDAAVLICNANDGQSVVRAIEGLKFKDIDSTFIISVLNERLNSPSIGFDTDAEEVRGYFFRFRGALYYGLILNGQVLGVSEQEPEFNNTFVYSFETGTWSEFQFGSSASHTNRYVFPVFCSAMTTTGNISTYVAGSTGGASPRAWFGQLDDCNLLSRNAVDFIDNYATEETNVYQEFRTPNLDFGTLNRKVMHRLGIDVEINDSDNTLTRTFYIQYNDNDYAATQWSTARAITYGGTSIDYFPIITQLGTFRRRALRMYNNDGISIRVKSFEININKGQV